MWPVPSAPIVTPLLVPDDPQRVLAPSACEVCLETERSPIFRCLPWLVRCSACRCWRSEPPPSEEELERIYDESYFDSFGACGDGEAGYGQLKLAAARHWLGVLGQQRVPGRLLDVGCGLGELVCEARRRGWESLGVDRNPSAVARANARGASAVCLDVERDAVASGAFEAITCLDVFEHFRSPRTILGKLQQALVPGGLLLVVTIDNAGLLARLSGSRWVHLHRDHVWYFNRPGLHRLVGDSGFRVLSGGRAWKRYTLRYVAMTLAHHSRSAPLRRGWAGLASRMPRSLCDRVWPALPEGQWLLAQKPPVIPRER